MRRALVVLLLILAGTSATGQTTPIDISALSGRLLPTSTPRTIGVLAALEEEEKRVTYLLLPMYLSTDGLWLGLLNGAAIFPTARPVRLDLSYTYLKPDGADHLNSYGATLRSTVWAKDAVGKVTLLGAYADTQQASTKTQLGGVGEYTFRGTPFSASADVRWVRSSASGGTDDLVPKIGAAFDRSTYTVAAEYTLKNDVDGEDDYSLELDVTTRAGIVIVGAGKHNTVFVGFLRIF